MYPERAANWVRLPEEGDCRRFGRVIRRDFKIMARTAAARGRKLGFLTDLHHRNDEDSERLLSDALEALKSFDPDILLLGGDLIGDCCEIPALPGTLRRIRAEFPAVCAVLGNHERSKKWISREYWCDIYEESGVPLLFDRGFEACGLYVYGKADLGRRDLPGSPEFSEKLENILLTHNPDTVIALDSGGDLDDMTLALTGHTHGGQLRLPFFRALLSASVYGRYFDSGAFVKKRCDGETPEMLISAGLGKLTFPFRFLCPPEVMTVTFF